MRWSQRCSHEWLTISLSEPELSLQEIRAQDGPSGFVAEVVKDTSLKNTRRSSSDQDRWIAPGDGVEGAHHLRHGGFRPSNYTIVVIKIVLAGAAPGFRVLGQQPSCCFGLTQWLRNGSNLRKARDSFFRRTLGISRLENGTILGLVSRRGESSPVSFIDKSHIFCGEIRVFISVS
jgi:hypothetical protein